MAETYQLKDILERFERSQKRLDRDEHFNAYCMLKLAGMKTMRKERKCSRSCS